MCGVGRMEATTAQIQKVEAEILDVNAEIAIAEEDLKMATEATEAEKAHLRKRVEQLRDKERQLRDKELLLMKQMSPPAPGVWVCGTEAALMFALVGFSQSVLQHLSPLWGFPQARINAMKQALRM